MPLPEILRVKLSSEDAGSVSISPVVLRDLPLRELIELMLGVTGKDPERVRELLLRGALVSGATRYRWQGWDADRGSIQQLLATFPDPDPARPFSAERCVRVVLQGPGLRVELPREAGARRRLLRKRSFWSVLMEVARSEEPRYLDYSYKEHTDCYRMHLSLPAAARLKENAGLVTYTTLENQIRGGVFDTIDLYVER